MKALVLILFIVFTPVLSSAGKVQRTQDAFKKYPKINVQMDIKAKVDKDSQTKPLHSVGGGQMGYAKRVAETVKLDIKLKNLGINNVGPFVLSIEIIGQKRGEGKVRENFIACQQEERIPAIKRGANWKLQSDPVEFTQGMAYGRFSNFMGTRRNGGKYRGYKVTLLYNGTPILIGTNR